MFKHSYVIRYMKSIKDFYKQLRPERFSDSSYEQEFLLPREQLDFILSQISINQKQENLKHWLNVLPKD